MKKTKSLAALAALALTTTTLAACGSASDEAGGGGDDSAPAATGEELCDGSDPVKISVINSWAEGLAVTHLWKKVLEDRGCTVELSEQTEAGPLYIGLSKGQSDVYLDAWLPMTHADYWNKYKNDYVNLGTWYDNAKLTMSVPTYMKDVNSIEDLPKIKGQVNNTITGIEPGAGLTKATNKAIKDYSLSGIKQQTSSSNAMLAALKKATDDEKPIVVALWRPHWAYDAYPVKDLKDPKGSLGEAEDIRTVANKDFPNKFPKVADLMKKFKMNDDQLASISSAVAVDHKDDPAAGVDAWLKKNPDFVKTVMS